MGNKRQLPKKRRKQERARKENKAYGYRVCLGTESSMGLKLNRQCVHHSQDLDYSIRKAGICDLTWLESFVPLCSQSWTGYGHCCQQKRRWPLPGMQPRFQGPLTARVAICQCRSLDPLACQMEEKAVLSGTLTWSSKPGSSALLCGQAWWSLWGRCFSPQGHIKS